MSKGLIRDFSKTDTTTMEDFYLCIAKSIENSLIESGAKPGKDYSIVDVYTLAQPFVMEEFKKGNLSIAAS